MGKRLHGLCVIVGTMLPLLAAIAIAVASLVAFQSIREESIYDEIEEIVTGFDDVTVFVKQLSTNFELAETRLNSMSNSVKLTTVRDQAYEGQPPDRGATDGTSYDTFTSYVTIGLGPYIDFDLFPVPGLHQIRTLIRSMASLEVPRTIEDSFERCSRNRSNEIVCDIGGPLKENAQAIRIWIPVVSLAVIAAIAGLVATNRARHGAELRRGWALLTNGPLPKDELNEVQEQLKELKERLENVGSVR